MIGEPLVIGLAVGFSLFALAVYVRDRRQEKSRCPACQGLGFTVAAGGRPDAQLCEYHFRLAWGQFRATHAWPTDGD